LIFLLSFLLISFSETRTKKPPGPRQNAPRHVDKVLKKKHQVHAKTRQDILIKFLKKKHQVHAKTRQDMLIKFFSDKVSPAVHDVAAKKEAFGLWNEEYVQKS
jgi:hypothetical protein